MNIIGNRAFSHTQLLALVTTLTVGCDPALPQLAGQASGTPHYGPTGVTVPVVVSAGEQGSNITVALVAVPTSISVSPTVAITDGDGNLNAFALVPYGVDGNVVASSIDAEAGAVPVSASPLALCNIDAVPSAEGGAVGPAGQVYTVSVDVRIGRCEDGVHAPVGIPLAFQLSQPSTPDGSSGATSAVVSAPTDAGGTARASLLVPWGANAVIQAAGGGSLASKTIVGLANPAAITCVEWKRLLPEVFEVSARAAVVSPNSTQPMPASPVALSIAHPVGAGAISPENLLTDSNGVAKALLTVADDATFPILLLATVGSSGLSVAIDDGESGSVGQCAK